MPSPHERTRNNVRMGIFVTIALSAAVAVIVILSGAWAEVTQRTETWTVIYPVSAGVSNLKSGGDVRVGGVTLGRVVEVQPDVKRGETFEEIHVIFDLDRDVQLYNDAAVYVASALIGSDAWLNITDVGEPSAGAPVRNTLRGSQTAGMLTTMLGAENAAATDEIVNSARQFSDFLAGIPHRYDAEIAPIFADVRATTTDVRELAEEMRHEQWPQWREQVDAVLSWANDFSGTLDQAAGEGTALLTDARGMLAENRQDVRAAVGNVEAASVDVQAMTSRLRSQTLDKVDELLETGKSGLADAVAVIERLRTDYEAWSVDLNDVLGNASLASQQLKLATIEIRRSPWKLLYRPTADELEHELLYEAARSFAVAAADLKAASESTQRILDRYGDRLDEDEQLLQRIRQNLLDPLQRYESAQERLFDVLVAE